MNYDNTGVPCSQWDYNDLTSSEKDMMRKLKEKYPNKNLKVVGRCFILADGQDPGQFYGPILGRCAWDFPINEYTMSSIDLDETFQGYHNRTP